MKHYIKRQKLIKVGNSYAVTLDKEFVDKLHEAKQAEVAVAYDLDNGVAGVAVHDGSLASKAYSTVAQRATLANRITPEFSAWVDQTLSEDKEAMEKLKDL